ncbi:hypothetical protein [Amycolatopsis sp. cmx-11-12]|uniref:hypothetical protein n=1 Tax=Amycolatopsis sp. cmx-11-12 TaxID=2785795 RepID=UPI00391759D4
MTDETESGPPQKTVAELLAQHGAQPEGGRRRRRRAADDEDEAPEPPRGRRAPSVSDTAPQAIIDRVSGDTPPPPSRPPRRSRPQDSGVRPVPPPQQQDSAPLPVPPNVASAPTRQTPPVRPPQPPQESGQFARPAPPQPPQQSGQFARPTPPQEQSGYQQRPPQPPQQSGQFARPTPPQEQSGYQQRPPDSEGLPPRGRPRPPGPEETRGAVPPVRRRPEPPAGPPSAGLSARLDGGADAPPEDVQEAPGPMASGAFATPPAQPARRRRPPARPAQPKAEPSTEQFAAVDDTEAEVPAPAEPAAPPAGLAGWRKRRQKVQSEDTEIGGIPPVPLLVAPVEPDADPEPDVFDAGPPTMASTHQPHPAPMPFVPPHSLDDRARQDELDDYEREFADPAYPDGGPDFARDDYGYRADEYEDDYDEQDADVVDEAEPEEPAENASPGKQWLALAGQLALGVVGGAGVWLGFNWLWVNIPAAALVAALLVIVALVWIVRKIRRADDLQTTVLAVLVGLVVTVSPAALLLVAR